ncbi:MAG: tetratricopeptide repeat protein, partial [Anaerolineales bacterium]
LGNLGLAHAALGDARTAIEFYEQQLVIAREIGDRSGEGNALGNMALALNSLGERERAIAHAEAALKIFEAIESPYAEQVRKQLAGWQKRSAKKWWQFWR